MAQGLGLLAALGLSSGGAPDADEVEQGRIGGLPPAAQVTLSRLQRGARPLESAAQIAVKIRHPGIFEAIEADISPECARLDRAAKGGLRWVAHLPADHTPLEVATLHSWHRPSEAMSTARASMSSLVGVAWKNRSASSAPRS